MRQCYEVSFPSRTAPQGAHRPRSHATLRHKLDWISLTHLGVAVGLILTTYLLAAAGVSWFWAAAVLAAPIAIYTNYVAHNHSHRGLARDAWFNRLLDHVLGFVSGTPLIFWRLHHVKNHHHNEGTAGDWSWNYGFEGNESPHKPISLWYYCATFSPLTFCHCTIEILRKPFSRDFYDYFISLAIIFAINFALIAWSWQAWLLTNGIVYLIAPFTLGFANYFHHYGCAERRGVKASNDFLHAFHNKLSYNIGYHIEHSMKPTMHWSELPAFYKKHKDEIPPEHVTFEFFPAGTSFGTMQKWLHERGAHAASLALEAKENATERIGGARDAASDRFDEVRENAVERFGEARDVAADVLAEAKRAATPPQVESQLR